MSGLEEVERVAVREGDVAEEGCCAQAAGMGGVGCQGEEGCEWVELGFGGGGG